MRVVDGTTVDGVSTHSRPKAAGCNKVQKAAAAYSFNTQPPEGGWGYGYDNGSCLYPVSTHSRPKAAGPL